MTFLEFANAKKWHQWFPQAIWLITAFSLAARDDYVGAFAFATFAAVATTVEFRAARWQRAAFQGLDVIKQQAALMETALDLLPVDARLPLRKQHFEIVSKFRI